MNNSVNTPSDTGNPIGLPFRREYTEGADRVPVKAHDAIRRQKATGGDVDFVGPRSSCR